jgi:hypothetical protein
MKLVRPSPPQIAAIVQAMSAVVSAERQVAPIPIEIESLAAAQVHLLRQDPPLPCTPGPLPADLAETLDTQAVRLQTFRMLALLPIIDRQVDTRKVAVVEKAAAALGIDDYGLTVLRLASKGRFKRLAFSLMTRFVAQYWSPTGQARLRDYANFFWWMLPQLHGRKTAQRNRELLARYQALAALPEGTFGNALHAFFIRHEIPLPGQPKSVPWAMHEVYHVLGEYGVALPAELSLTGFIGGTQEESCLDQMLFGLLSYQAGRQIVGGFATEGVLRPDEYFRAIARGAEINVDLMSNWNIWDVVSMALPTLRASYDLPRFTDQEREELQSKNALLTGPGFTLLEEPATHDTVPDQRRPTAAVSGSGQTEILRLATIWRDDRLRQTLMKEPKATLRRLGFVIPDSVTVKAVGSKGAPSDKGDTLLQFIFELGPRFMGFFLPSPLHPSAQQAAYGRTVGNSVDDPVFEHRAYADAAVALGAIGAATPVEESAVAAE